MWSIQWSKCMNLKQPELSTHEKENCKSLPFFYFITFEKADCSIFALLVGRLVGRSVGWRRRWMCSTLTWPRWEDTFLLRGCLCSTWRKAGLHSAGSSTSRSLTRPSPRSTTLPWCSSPSTSSAASAGLCCLPCQLDLLFWLHDVRLSLASWSVSPG